MKHDGIIDFEALNELLTDDVLLVSTMATNNEIGVNQPLEKIGTMCKEKGAIFHVDAAQGAYANIDVVENHVDMLSLKCLYFRDRDTSTTPPSVVHPQKVIITSKREIENYIPISSIEEKFDVTFTPYEIEHWNDMDVANSLYNKGIRFGNDQKHSENVIKQILQGQNIWNQIILSPENRSEIQDWFQQMKDFFEDAGW